MPPYIRRTKDNRLLVTVAEPVERDRHTVGIILLTREAREVDDSLFTVRMSILALFGLALGLTVLLSWYLSLTIARPILRLARRGAEMREGKGRAGSVPPRPARAARRGRRAGRRAVRDGQALWARMDAIERFAADVAHEIKNPLSSIRSAIETLRRIEDPAAAAAAAGHHRRGRDAARPADQRHQRRVARRCRTVARGDRAGGCGADPGDARAKSTTRRAARAIRALELDAPAERPGGAGGGGPAGAGAAQPDRQRGIVQPAATAASALTARETGGDRRDQRRGRGAGHSGGKLEHVFDRFYSERPKGERFGQHSGLGLSISRQIVEALRGRISAENRRDIFGKVIGARFVVRLPRA